MRSLSPEEHELWARVTSTIRPLSRAKEPKEAPEVKADVDQPRSARARAAVKKVLLVAPPSPAPGTTLDGTWDRRLRSGSIDPDRTVDLHGLNLDRAWRAIDDALEQSIARGDRVLLLITGHQRSGEPPIRRGAIRAAVHDWLAVSRHSSAIAAVRGAHGKHGGGGSLYIILRKARQR